MTLNGWIQIALFAVIIIALTKPLGGYMTRVFNGERTLLSPILRPIERVFYGISGVNEKEDQHWLVYAIAMLAFSMAGFLSLYALQRLQAARRDQAETSVLFELIAERYERKSIAITANTPFSQWGEVFVDAAMTVAAVDRLVHHSTILEMNVESYRRRIAQAAQVPAKRARAATTTATT